MILKNIMVMNLIDLLLEVLIEYKKCFTKKGNKIINTKLEQYLTPLALAI
jgi:hypothetical protein